MKVKDYSEFRMCEYNSTTEPTKITFGDIVTKVDEDGTQIGIVIQVHDRYEFRVDMFGNTSIDEVTISTLNEIREHRPKLMSKLVMREYMCNECGEDFATPEAKTQTDCASCSSMDIRETT